MATFQKRAGKWRAIIRKKGYKPLSKTFPKKAMAQEWAKGVEADMARREYRDISNFEPITVKDAIERYEFEVGKYRPIGRSKRWVLSRLKETPLAERPLLELDVQDFVDYCKGRVKTVAPSTNSQDIVHLGEVLKVARVMWGYPVSADLIIRARETLKHLKLIGKAKRRDRRPETAEIESLHKEFTRNKRIQMPMADIVDFAIYSAMRLGEICRIEWKDLDKDKRTIIIRDRKDPEEKEGNDQVVPLLGEAFDIVNRQPRIDPKIFPFDARSVSARFTRVCTKLGIKDLHFHDLRHEGASRLFEQGYQIQEVALITGHRDWASLKRYTQLKPESLHRD